MFKRAKRLFSSSTSRDTLASMVGNAGIAVGGMLFTIIAARSMSPDKFGIFSALLALYILMASIGELGIPSALINFLPKLNTDRSILISVTFWFQTITGLFFALIVIGLITLRQIIIPGASTGEFFLVALLVFNGVIEGFTQGLLKAERHFILASALWMLDSFTKLALLFALFLNNQVTIASALVVTLFSGVLATIIALSREFKNIRPIFSKLHFRQIYLFTRWIALTRVFTVGIAQVNVIFLISLATSYQAGIFAAANRIALLFSIIVSSLGSVVAPRFSSFSQNEAVRSYLKKILMLMGVVSIGMLACLVLVSPIVRFVYGSEYLETIPVFQLLTLAMIPFLFSVVTVNPIIYTYNQPNFIALTSFIQMIILIGLDIILIPRYGAYAPCIALAVSNLVVMILTGWKLNRLLS